MRRPDPDADLDETSELRPGDIVDEFSTEAGTVLMVGREPTFQVLRLSLLGAEIIRLVRAGTTLGELADDLRDRLGAPPSGDLRQLVRVAVVDLRHQGAIVAGQGPKDDISDVT